MAVREFTDDQGMAWKAWNITPESIHPVTRAEDYLVDCFQLGWLVFENADCTDKRRLCPYPSQWDACTDAQLAEMLRRAERVAPLRAPLEREVTGWLGQNRALAPRMEEAAPDLTDLRVVRTFRYPGGRFWTVCVLEHPDDGGPRRLRFTSGMRFIDLESWPRDWPDYQDDRLAELLRRAAPRPAGVEPAPGSPRRRWDDQPEASR